MAATIGAKLPGNLVYRQLPDLPVSVPPECKWWKIKIRPQCCAVIYLRRADRIEKWLLVEKDGQLMPGIQIAENRRKAVDITVKIV